jgi:tRNA-specific 2-thiouridylase
MSSKSDSEELFLNKRAVALISGGLDSALAIHLVKKQGIEVTGLHFTSFFSPVDPRSEDSPITVTAGQLDIPVLYRPKGDDFIQLLRNPRYGYGKNLNPCIDCRIYTFVKAKTVMREIGASFIVTGEVVGQRPMSQRRNTMRLIEKQSGCDGIVLRPLSAKILPPTLPEQAGIIDRDQLLDVAGRGRKVQLRLARELGLTGYSPPAGGCLLTDQNFSRRLKDLLDDREDVRAEDLALLAIGRHLRLRPGLKIVVGRREAENDRLEELADAGTLFYPVDFPGPVVLAQGRPEPAEEQRIGSIIRRYSREADRGDWIGIRNNSAEERRIRVAEVAQDEWISDHMI